MNQIPNIGGTIEGIKSWLEVKSADFVEGYYEGRCDADREHHHQLQKARTEGMDKKDWLREEIVRLEGIKSSIDDFDYDSDERGKREILQTIIERYHSELDQPTPWQCGKCTQERDGVKGDEIPEHHRSCKQRTELDQDKV